MLFKRIPINIVLLCLEDVIGFLFIEFQEGELREITFFGCFSGFFRVFSWKFRYKCCLRGFL